jgi:hypothetical protein
MNYKRASAEVLASHVYFSKPVLFFPHRGTPQGCEVFNEIELMYPEALIKFHSPKKSKSKQSQNS